MPRSYEGRDRDDCRDPCFGVGHSEEYFLHGWTVLDRRDHSPGIFPDPLPRSVIAHRLNICDRTESQCTCG